MDKPSKVQIRKRLEKIQRGETTKCDHSRLIGSEICYYCGGQMVEHPLEKSTPEAQSQDLMRETMTPSEDWGGHGSLCFAPDCDCEGIKWLQEKLAEERRKRDTEILAEIERLRKELPPEKFKDGWEYIVIGVQKFINKSK
jgi:hypothetical protein